MIFCPNTGLRHLPADYKTVLDNFYLTCVAKKRNARQEQKGRFMTAEQFVAGSHSFKSKHAKGSLCLTQTQQTKKSASTSCATATRSRSSTTR